MVNKIIRTAEPSDERHRVLIRLVELTRATTEGSWENDRRSDLAFWTLYLGTWDTLKFASIVYRFWSFVYQYLFRIGFSCCWHSGPQC